MSPWPGCGKPANEFARLAATEQLKLIGQDPNPSLQRYVDLIGTCYQVYTTCMGVQSCRPVSKLPTQDDHATLAVHTEH